MKYSILFLLSFFIFSCDDPSLEDPNSGIDEVIEPVQDLRQLSSIQVAFNTPTNITRDINFIYNELDLLSSIMETGNLNQSTTANYSNGNKLENLIIEEGVMPAVNVDVVYGNDDSVQAISTVELSFIDMAGVTHHKTLYIDAQNRFNRVVTTETDLTGVTTQVEELRLEYSQNFNVLRIEEIANDGFTITGYSDFTYNFNNNPFTDMNDIIRLFMFDEFVPYSRYLPATRLDYDLSTGTAILERSIDYQYVLDTEGYPVSRELSVTEGMMTSLYFEFFNYRS
ncbi:hypothetical protein BST92_08010 [Nonlabens arenilitoris]|uniref:Uncharacterized protein n=1 Tax=Nonlabens arenilitoris TaxID=1217969 RepID=A0A2S7UBT4_9FLAO|nr:hypothetical protein [Nonlabens arenilitoris]PQJ31874.1 hypothetical protein BST92_08010 [Nonlabens arenilitoris]